MASDIYSLNVSGEGALQVGAGNWLGVGSGFSLPPRYLYLGPSGKNVYYDGSGPGLLANHGFAKLVAVCGQ